MAILATLLALATSAIPAQAEVPLSMSRNYRPLGDRPIILACNQEININCVRHCFMSSMGQGKSTAEIDRDCAARCKRTSGC